jgi:hypothetical protein
MRTRHIFQTLTRLAKGAGTKATLIGFVVAVAVTPIPVGGTPASAQPSPSLGPVDVARQAGVYRYMRSWSVNAADINKDGHDDLFVPEHDPEASQRGEDIPNPHMFMGSSTGHFTDRGWPGTPTDRHDCSWADVNNDGRLDMFCAVGLTSNSVNELWIQNADGTFTNRAAAYGITANTHGRYRTSSFIDVNNDGWPDIFVTRYSGANGDPGNPLPPEPNPYPNELWINHLATGGGFTKDTNMGISTVDSAGRFNNQCNQSVDYNGDGTRDLLLCTGSGVHLYRNGGAKFTDVAGSLGIGGKWNDAGLTDLNNDGLPDLFEVRDNTLRVMQQTASGTFKQIFSMPVTLGLNVAAGDFDGNGYKDIYVVGSCSSTGTAFPPDSPDHLLYNNYDSTTHTWNFSSQVIPAIMPKGGCGDDVASLDYNGDGLTDFFVTNGRRQERGPTQLWT